MSKVSYHQRPHDEKTFHAFVQFILVSMGFDPQTEKPGAVGRLDLHVELPDRVHLIIELKYRRDLAEPTPKAKNHALAVEMTSTLPPDEIYELLAPTARRMMKMATILKVIESSAKDNPSKAEMDRLLGRAALDFLPEGVIDKALAEAALGLLPPERIEAASLEAAVGLADRPEAEIDGILSKAAGEALREIVEGGYHDIISSDAKEIIDLGLAVYGHGDHVKAVFGNAPGPISGAAPDEGEYSPKRVNPKKGQAKA